MYNNLFIGLWVFSAPASKIGFKMIKHDETLSKLFANNQWYKFAAMSAKITKRTFQL